MRRANQRCSGAERPSSVAQRPAQTGLWSGAVERGGTALQARRCPTHQGRTSALQTSAGSGQAGCEASEGCQAATAQPAPFITQLHRTNHFHSCRQYARNGIRTCCYYGRRNKKERSRHWTLCHKMGSARLEVKSICWCKISGRACDHLEGYNLYKT